MSASRPFSICVLLFAIAVPVYAQEPSLQQLSRCSVLVEHGRFREALDLVEPLLHSTSQNTNDGAIGIAWNLRGLAFQGLEEEDQAIRSYETAIGILRTIPSQQAQYAAALDNLGSVKAEMDQMEESKSLRLHARKLYESLGDHAGIARASGNLALVAMGQGKYKDARRYVADAVREESLVSNPIAGDVAAIDSAECLQDVRDRNLRSALDAINRAIALWVRTYGENYYMLPDGYSMRGQVYDRLRDFPDAVKDMQHSLELLADNHLEGSQLYFYTELSYARVLRDSGVTKGATQIESAARSALESLRHQQCTGCTISAESLR